jgi:hypothetical protein
MRWNKNIQDPWFPPISTTILKLYKPAIASSSPNSKSSMVTWHFHFWKLNSHYFQFLSLSQARASCPHRGKQCHASPSDHNIPVAVPLAGADSVKCQYSVKVSRPLPESGLSEFGSWLSQENWKQLLSIDIRTLDNQKLYCIRQDFATNFGGPYLWNRASD